MASITKRGPPIIGKREFAVFSEADIDFMSDTPQRFKDMLCDEFIEL